MGKIGFLCLAGVCGEMRLKKGIIFTLDALIALLFLTSALTITFFYLKQMAHEANEAVPDVYSTVAMDAMTVLEKSYGLANSLNGGDDIERFIDSLPSNLCANITVYSAENSIMFSREKSGCTAEQESARNIYVAWRVFIVNHSFYYAGFRGWSG